MTSDEQGARVHGAKVPESMLRYEVLACQS
jgi:hypothetical protein